MPEQTPQQQQIAPALIEESFGVDGVNVIGQEAQGPNSAFIVLRFLVGPMGNGAFMTAKLARVLPDMAVQLGEHLVREGTRLKSGVVIPQAGLPADFAAKR